MARTLCYRASGTPWQGAAERKHDGVEGRTKGGRRGRGHGEPGLSSHTTPGSAPRVELVRAAARRQRTGRTGTCGRRRRHNSRSRGPAGLGAADRSRRGAARGPSAARPRLDSVLGCRRREVELHDRSVPVAGEPVWEDPVRGRLRRHHRRGVQRPRRGPRHGVPDLLPSRARATRSASGLHVSRPRVRPRLPAGGGGRYPRDRHRDHPVRGGLHVLAQPRRTD